MYAVDTEVVRMSGCRQRDRSSVNPHATLVRAFSTHENLDQCRLAGAIRAVEGPVVPVGSAEGRHDALRRIVPTGPHDVLYTGGGRIALQPACRNVARPLHLAGDGDLVLCVFDDLRGGRGFPGLQFGP